MNSRILNFFNVKLDAFIVFVSVVVVIMFIALFFLLLDYLKMRKRYVEFMKMCIRDRQNAHRNK